MPKNDTAENFNWIFLYKGFLQWLLCILLVPCITSCIFYRSIVYSGIPYPSLVKWLHLVPIFVYRFTFTESVQSIHNITDCAALSATALSGSHSHKCRPPPATAYTHNSSPQMRALARVTSRPHVRSATSRGRGETHSQPVSGPRERELLPFSNFGYHHFSYRGRLVNTRGLLSCTHPTPSRGSICPPYL